MDNNQNPARGAEFERQAQDILSEHFGVVLQRACAIPIGYPPLLKEHQFDLATEDLKCVGECKNISWTESGNVPSAKMTSVNQAVFYLTFVSDAKYRFVVMKRDTHPRRQETLAEYYYRTYRHLLGEIFIIEIDITTKAVKEFGKSS